MGGFSYPDQFTFEADFAPVAVGTGALGVFFAIYLFVMFIASAVSMVSYVLFSLGLYNIADRRGIKHSWLAWVPIGNLWILGSISDQYQYVVKGKIKSRRKLLLGLSIGTVLAYIAFVIAFVVGLIVAEGMGGGMAAGILLLVLGVLVIVAMAVVLTVYQFVCLNDLYTSCNPGNSVLFLVLSILFSVTMPFFVFACRKKDLGMPPRKQPAPEPVLEYPAEEPVTEEGYAQPEEFEEE